MPGPLDLDRDALAGVAGPRDGPGRSTRRRTTRSRTSRKTTSGSAAELLADDLAHLLVRERLDLVEQLEELVAVGGRQQVEPHRQHLAELDPGAAELLEREAHPDRAGSGSSAAGTAAREDEVAAEDADDLPDPARVPEQRSQRPQAQRASGARRARRRPAIGTDAGGLAARVRGRRRRAGRAGAASGRRTRPPTRGRPERAPRSPAATSSTMRLNAPSAASWASRG